MRRGTTPTITIRVRGETFDDSTIFVTFRQGNILITKTGDDVDKSITLEGCMLYIYLSQEETLSLHNGVMQIQIRWINFSNLAKASPIKTIQVDPILLEGVIEYDA